MMTMYPNVPVKRLDPELPLPSYAYEGDAGMDLRITRDVTLHPHETVQVGTGFAFAIPDGFYGDVRPRSGMAKNLGVTLANTPGTVDSRYRGEVMLPLHNIGTEDVMVKRGERVVQMLIKPVAHATLVEVDELDATERGSKGFGSSGRL